MWGRSQDGQGISFARLWKTLKRAGNTAKAQETLHLRGFGSLARIALRNLRETSPFLLEGFKGCLTP
jgi:hypothetical protein